MPVLVMSALTCSYFKQLNRRSDYFSFNFAFIPLTSPTTPLRMYHCSILFIRIIFYNTLVYFPHLTCYLVYSCLHARLQWIWLQISTKSFSTPSIHEFLPGSFFIYYLAYPVRTFLFSSTCTILHFLTPLSLTGLSHSFVNAGSILKLSTQFRAVLFSYSLMVIRLITTTITLTNTSELFNETVLFWWIIFLYYFISVMNSFLFDSFLCWYPAHPVCNLLISSTKFLSLT